MLNSCPLQISLKPNLLPLPKPLLRGEGSRKTFVAVRRARIKAFVCGREEWKRAYKDKLYIALNLCFLFYCDN